MAVKSLWELATATCLKNIRELESVGDYLPYEVVRHILLKVDNAPQLRQIELNSPQIEGETGEIWLKLIEREFPLEIKANSYKPQNPKKWYRVWEKYKRDHDNALEESERKLKNALAGLQEDKAKNTSKIIHNKKYLPRERKARRGWGRDPSMSTLAFGSGSRTKTSTGASVMRKVRRETKEIATIHGVLARPVKGGPSQRTQVRAAPQSMISDHRRAAQPVYRPLAKTSDPSDAVAEHEDRATFISDSEDDEPDSEPFDEPVRSSDPPGSKPRSASSSVRNSGPPAKSPNRQPTRAVVAPTPQKKLFSGSSKKGSGLLSNSYRPAASKPQSSGSVPKPISKSSTDPATTSKPRPQPTEESSKAAQYLPHTQSSPPLDPTADPSSPPPQSALSGASDAPGRKRKAVDIFMRRKKKPA